MTHTSRSDAFPSPAALRFAPPTPTSFAAQVRHEVAAYFAATGLSTTSDVRVWIRAGAMLALVCVPYGLLLGGVLTGWVALAACVVIGVGVAGMGFTLGHDAQHGALSKRGYINRLAGLTFDVMGVNGHFWRLTHNRLHHTFTNVAGLDEDLSVTPLLRMSPDSKRRAIHRFQHVFALPVYALLTLSWILLKDYVYLLRRRLGPLQPVPRPRAHWATVLAGKAFHYGWTIVVPVLVLQPSFGAFLAGFLAMHFTASLILSVVFQLAHHVESTVYPSRGEDGRSEDTWAAHQVRTTSDFARGNIVLGWYLGGLNFQVEHHLFPNVCSVHYPRLSPIVEACARRHGLPFHAAPTFRSALRSHARRLRDLGARAPLPTLSGVATS